MNHFIRTFPRAEDGQIDFYFTRIYTDSGETYMVTAIDSKIRSHLFHMILDGSRWRIDRRKKNIAGWILDLEADLSKAIEAHGH